jgi:hypothetical protein
LIGGGNTDKCNYIPSFLEGKTISRKWNGLVHIKTFFFFKGGESKMVFGRY